MFMNLQNMTICAPKADPKRFAPPAPLRALPIIAALAIEALVLDASAIDSTVAINSALDVSSQVFVLLLAMYPKGQVGKQVSFNKYKPSEHEVHWV